MNNSLLSFIPPKQARTAWPLLRDRLLKLGAEYGDGWLPEDIFADIMNGTAYLWATEGFGGFVVLTVEVSAWDRRMRAWIADNESHTGAADYWKQLKLIAADAQCSHLFFESPRRWERALQNVEVRHIYITEIGN